jgi:starch synthase
MTPRVAFVNGGILGLLSYAKWLRRSFADDRDIHAEHFVLTEHLTLTERIVRRVLCQRLWPDPRGWRNLDLARFRQEYHAGLEARRRLLARGLERFDVLHFHAQATAYASLDLMRQRPSIVSIDCTQRCAMQSMTSAVERRTLWPNIRRDGRIFQRAAAIVSPSTWAADDLREMYPGLRKPIHVMPTPVALDLFDAHWADERCLRPRARPQCLFVGGDFPRKGGYDLLGAWTAGGFAARAELTLMTDWPIGRALPPGVRQLRGVQGHSPEWRAAWQDADLFVMPTRNEAFGFVYQEAGAAALPAIGSRLNAVPEIIEDGQTGLLVTPGNMAELVAALDTLIGSAELCDRLGRAARRKIEIDASPDAHRQRLVAVIDQVMRHD